jgi:hypothetical protein
MLPRQESQQTNLMRQLKSLMMITMIELSRENSPDIFFCKEKLLVMCAVCFYIRCGLRPERICSSLESGLEFEQPVVSGSSPFNDLWECGRDLVFVSSECENQSEGWLQSYNPIGSSASAVKREH